MHSARVLASATRERDALFGCASRSGGARMGVVGVVGVVGDVLLRYRGAAALDGGRPLHLRLFFPVLRLLLPLLLLVRRRALLLRAVELRQRQLPSLPSVCSIDQRRLPLLLGANLRFAAAAGAGGGGGLVVRPLQRAVVL